MLGSERLKALTDGVVAVIITIMVLEMKPPADASLAALLPVAPVLLAYALSFVYVAIYWNNHHHFFALAPAVDGGVLWANFNLLFWLSLIPFTTAWVGAHPLSRWPTVLYGLVLLACALSWLAMQAAIIRVQGPASLLRRAIGRDAKGWASMLLYLLGIGLAFVRPAMAIAVFAGIAGLWLIPDRRVHRAMPRDEA